MQRGRLGHVSSKTHRPNGQQSVLAGRVFAFLQPAVFWSADCPALEHLQTWSARIASKESRGSYSLGKPCRAISRAESPPRSCCNCAEVKTANCGQLEEDLKAVNRKLASAVAQKELSQLRPAECTELCVKPTRGLHHIQGSAQPTLRPVGMSVALVKDQLCTSFLAQRVCFFSYLKDL